MPVHEIRLVPQANLLVAAAGDGHLYLIDTNSGQTIRKIETGIPSLHALSVSRDGTLLATGGVTQLPADRAVPHIYSVETGRRLQQLPGQPTTIESLEFSADGNWLAVGSRYENVQMIGLSGGQHRTLAADRRHLWLSTSSDGRVLAVQKSSAQILLADLHPPFSENLLQLPMNSSYAAWLPKSRDLLSVSQEESTIRLFDTASGAVKCEFVAGQLQIEAFYVSEDGLLLLAGTNSGEVVAWRVPVPLPELSKNGSAAAEVVQISPIGIWHLATSAVTSVAATHASIYASSINGELIAMRRPAVLNFAQADFSPQNAQLQQIASAAWSADGKFLLAGRRDGSVVWLDVSGQTMSDDELKVILRGDESFREPTQQHVPDASGGLTVLMPPVDISREPLQRDARGVPLQTQAHRITAVACPADGKVLAWARLNEGIFVRDHAGIRQIRTSGVQEPGQDSSIIDAIVFSSDGRHLAWTGRDSRLSICDLTTATPPMSVTIPGHGRCLCWEPDDGAVLCGGKFTTLLRLPLATGILETVCDFGNAVGCLAMSPDDQQPADDQPAEHGAGSSSADSGTSPAGSFDIPPGWTLITGHQDGTVRFTTRHSRRQPTFHLHTLGVRALTVSPQGLVGVSIDEGGSPGLWFTSPPERIGILTPTPTPPRPALSYPLRPAIRFTSDGGALQMLWESFPDKLNLRRWHL